MQAPHHRHQRGSDFRQKSVFAGGARIDYQNCMGRIFALTPHVFHVKQTPMNQQPQLGKQPVVPRGTALT
jgi:hypothetical protein